MFTTDENGISDKNGRENRLFFNEIVQMGILLKMHFLYKIAIKNISFILFICLLTLQNRATSTVTYLKLCRISNVKGDSFKK